MTVTVSAVAAATTAPSATTANFAAATTTAAAAAGGNLQTFTGARTFSSLFAAAYPNSPITVGGISAPAVTAGGRNFVVANNDDFVNLATALGRSCDVQHNECADKANSGGGFSVGQFDSQNTDCHAAISA